jgi:hypothetical protein
MARVNAMEALTSGKGKAVAGRYVLFLRIRERGRGGIMVSVCVKVSVRD